MNQHEAFRGRRRRAAQRRNSDNAKRRAELRDLNFPAHMSTQRQEELTSIDLYGTGDVTRHTPGKE